MILNAACGGARAIGFGTPGIDPGLTVALNINTTTFV